MKTNGEFIEIDNTTDAVEDDVISFRINSIRNDTGKYTVSLKLQNNDVYNVSSSISDLLMDTNFIKAVYIYPSSNTNRPLLLKIRKEIPTDYTNQYAVLFYSEPSYEKLYDFFYVNPKTDVTVIPLKFKDKNTAYTFKSIRNSTDYYVTLYVQVPDDPEFKKRYEGLFINFESDVENINDIIQLSNIKFTGGILTRKTSTP